MSGTTCRLVNEVWIQLLSYLFHSASNPRPHLSHAFHACRALRLSFEGLRGGEMCERVP